MACLEAAHFEAHKRLMDAIAPYFSVPQDHLDAWKAFFHDPQEILDTLRRQIVYDTEKLPIDSEKNEQMATTKYESSGADVLVYLDDFKTELVRIAKQSGSTVKAITDEINMVALNRFPMAKVIDPRMKGLRFSQLRVRTGYYIDDWIEQDRRDFFDSCAVMYDGCD